MSTMLSIVSLLPILLLSAEALQTSTTMPYFGDNVVLGKRDTNQFKTENAVTYTSGFLRTDVFSHLENTWTRAQVLLVGVCIKEGDRTSSAQISEVTTDFRSINRTTNLFHSPDCSGNFSSVMSSLPIKESFNMFDYVHSYVPDLDTAIEIQSSSGGIIFTSYYSSKSCSGAVAQYDLFATNSCNAYDHPISAFGTFSECDAEGGEMALILYGTFDGKEYTHPTCEPLSAGFEDGALLGEDAIRYGHRIIKQPFQCTEQNTSGGEQESFPLSQTVRCVAGKPDSLTNEGFLNNAFEGCAEEGRDPEFDLFYGTDVVRL